MPAAAPAIGVTTQTVRGGMGWVVLTLTYSADPTAGQQVETASMRAEATARFAAADLFDSDH